MSFIDPKLALSMIEQHMTDGALLFDRFGKLLFASASNRNLLGFVPNRSAQWFKTIVKDDRRLLMQTMKQMMNGKGPRTIEFRCLSMFVNQQPAPIWIQAIASPVLDEHMKLSHVIVMMRNITEIKINEQDLMQMAFHDPLTGLANRRLFKEHLHNSIAQVKRDQKLMAVLYMDVDDFKLINDQMGHDIGDQFLIAFAKRLKKCVREIDTVARMGGDEFTVLLPVIEHEQNVIRVANRIIEAFKQEWQIDEYQFTATVSMGIVIYPATGVDDQLLLSYADTAMYQAKNEGKCSFQIYKSP